MEPMRTRRQVFGLGLGAAALSLVSCDPTTPRSTAGAPPGSEVRASSTPAPPPASPSSRPVSGGAAVMIDRSTSAAAQVALTFHGSGDLSITRQVMAILAAHSAHATVFAVGKWLAANPQAARMVLDGGNELGNHTWSHPQLSKESEPAIYRQIVRCRDELMTLTGSPGAFFRQSDGQYPTPAELVQAGRAGYRRILAYDIDSTDDLGSNTQTIRRAVAAASAGSIISMHLGRANTVAALPAVLSDLAVRGLAVVTGSQLLNG